MGRSVAALRRCHRSQNRSGAVRPALRKGAEGCTTRNGRAARCGAVVPERRRLRREENFGNCRCFTFLPRYRMLHDLFVVELAGVLAGPSVGMFFAELGATVVKVEPPAGDVTRSWKLPGEDPDSDISAYFSSVNWGKTSVTANLLVGEEREKVYELISRADIVIVSYKPGDDVKLGMDYATLSALNPRLIYAQITGYGREEERTGYDAVIQAESGFMAMNGTPDSGPLKMPVALIDVLAAHQLKEAVLLALLHRERTGGGSRVEVSLFQAGVASLVNQASGWLCAGVEPQRIGSEHPTIVPYGTVFRTRDDRSILLAVGSNAQFRALCTVLDLAVLADDPRFTTNYQRVCNRQALLPLLADAIAGRQCDDLLARLHEHNVPCGAVNSMSEVFRHPAVRALLLHENNAPRGVRSLAFSASFLTPQDLMPPPHSGELSEFNTDMM